MVVRGLMKVIKYYCLTVNNIKELLAKICNQLKTQHFYVCLKTQNMIPFENMLFPKSAQQNLTIMFEFKDKQHLEECLETHFLYAPIRILTISID